MDNDSIQEIVCCMGQPVAGNPTQFMMERAFDAAGLAWRYLTLEVPPENLSDGLRGLRAMGMRGGNFTIPHKVAVIEHLDDLTPAARLMGAVNCVFKDGEKLIGENTDGKGFVQALNEVASPEGKVIEILGAGGAARAIAVEMALSGASRITIVNRSAGRGEELTKLLQDSDEIEAEARFFSWEGNYSVKSDTDILINATSIGLGDPQARVPVDSSTLRPELICADVIFNPAKTQFLIESADAGCTTIDGLGMLVNQAVISFKRWTDVDPDPNVMREALEEFLGF